MAERASAGGAGRRPLLPPPPSGAPPQYDTLEVSLERRLQEAHGDALLREERVLRRVDDDIRALACRLDAERLERAASVEELRQAFERRLDRLDAEVAGPAARYRERRPAPEVTQGEPTPSLAETSSEAQLRAVPHRHNFVHFQDLAALMEQLRHSQSQVASMDANGRSRFCHCAGESAGLEQAPQETAVPRSSLHAASSDSGRTAAEATAPEEVGAATLFARLDALEQQLVAHSSGIARLVQLEALCWDTSTMAARQAEATVGLGMRMDVLERRLAANSLLSPSASVTKVEPPPVPQEEPPTWRDAGNEAASALRTELAAQVGAAVRDFRARLGGEAEGMFASMRGRVEDLEERLKAEFAATSTRLGKRLEVLEQQPNLGEGWSARTLFRGPVESKGVTQRLKSAPAEDSGAFQGAGVVDLNTTRRERGEEELLRDMPGEASRRSHSHPGRAESEDGLCNVRRASSVSPSRRAEPAGASPLPARQIHKRETLRRCSDQPSGVIELGAATAPLVAAPPCRSSAQPSAKQPARPTSPRLVRPAAAVGGQASPSRGASPAARRTMLPPAASASTQPSLPAAAGSSITVKVPWTPQPSPQMTTRALLEPRSPSYGEQSPSMALPSGGCQTQTRIGGPVRYIPRAVPPSPKPAPRPAVATPTLGPPARGGSVVTGPAVSRGLRG